MTTDDLNTSPVLDSERSPEQHEFVQGTSALARRKLLCEICGQPHPPQPEAARCVECRHDEGTYFTGACVISGCSCVCTFSAPVEAPADGCKWTNHSSPDCDIWETDCGEAFVFETDGPTANKMRFCCYCSKRLEEVVIRHDDE